MAEGHAGSPCPGHKRAGLAVNGGALVDRCPRTSDPDIFAMVTVRPTGTGTGEPGTNASKTPSAGRTPWPAR
ncbi:hypothetical protein GCM10027445_26730 [Amycolatopsis endophytica]